VLTLSPPVLLSAVGTIRTTGAPITYLSPQSCVIARDTGRTHPLVCPAQCGQTPWWFQGAKKQNPLWGGGSKKPTKIGEIAEAPKSF